MSFAMTAPIGALPQQTIDEQAVELIARPLAEVHQPLLQKFSYPTAQFSVQLWHNDTAPSCGVHLVKEAYSRLGYLGTEPCSHRLDADSVTLHAIQHERTIGTLTVNFDSPPGLQAEALYPEEISALRRQGQVCEFTRLAMDRSIAGKEVLCGLFYMAYAYSHRIKQINNLVIEVNPHHEAFYARMLGFRRSGPERLCPRVSAPAVLMSLDLRHTREQIAKARQDQRFASAALYRYALGAAEERALIRRMRLGALNPTDAADIL